MKPPVVNIDPQSFWSDPYLVLQQMRAESPICFVSQLNAVLFCKRDDIFTCEKNITVFSSEQPHGLMTRLMGENMMRKDGEAHMQERKQAFPALSPRTVRDVWKAHFIADTHAVLDGLEGKESFDLACDFAMPVSGNALRHITGLTQLTPQEMDRASQHMIDGVGNYAGDADIEARCVEAAAFLDAGIDEVAALEDDGTATDMVRVLKRSGQPHENIRSNVKLAISGGQNEPRDAISGAVWGLLTFPDQLEKVRAGEASWFQVFEEYARWISPIGMSPREIKQDFIWNGIELETGQRVFFMFSSANRDEDYFEHPDAFDVTRDTSKAISFGAGPHFCAGAAASRTLIAEVALPLLFERFPNLQLDGKVEFGGWAFRGPLSVPVRPQS